MNTELGIWEVNKEHIGLYKMCKDFIRSADRLKEEGAISEEEYIELTRLKKDFIEDNKHLCIEME